MNQLMLDNHAKAKFDASYYTLDQLKSTRNLTNFGFVLANMAAFGLIATYLMQFFAGAALENIADWRGIQFLFAALGFAVACALAMAEAVLFKSGRSREYLFVLIFSVCFGVFAELSSAMQREAEAVKFKSQHSEVFKATISAANNLASQTGLSTTQSQLANAQALLSQNQDANERAVIRNRISQLENRIQLEHSNRQALLTTTLNNARDLEYDERNHQAIIRFMAEVLGFNHLTANALLSLFMVITFKLCSHYLGALKQRTDRSIAIVEGELVFDAELVNNRPTLSHSPSAPVHGLLHGQNRATSVVTRTYTDKNTDSPLVRDTDKSEQKQNNDQTDMEDRYLIARDKKAGEQIECPTCQTVFKKKTYNHYFCKVDCKDIYWNVIRPERLIEARAGAGK